MPIPTFAAPAPDGLVEAAFSTPVEERHSVRPTNSARLKAAWYLAGGNDAMTATSLAPTQLDAILEIQLAVA